MPQSQEVDEDVARERAAGVIRADYGAVFTAERLAALRALPLLVRNGMAEQDFAATLAFYSKRYVRQIPDFIEQITPDKVICDVGCGVGFLAITLALETPARVLAYEYDPESLATAQEVVRILGLEQRIEFRRGDLSAGIDLADHAADLVYCVEVLEHVFKDRACVRELARIVGGHLVMTTPNLWFPKVAHDTRLPFAHWLPLSLRPSYARLLGKNPNITHNLFWSPAALAQAMPGLRRCSKFLHYASLQRYVDSYPFYMPYDRGYWEHAPSTAKLAYYRLVAEAPAIAHILLPNLAGTFRRR